MLSWLFSGGPEPVACAQAGTELEDRVSTLEAIVAGCLNLPDSNQNGVPDCGEIFCGNNRCDPGETEEDCEDCRDDLDGDGVKPPDDCDDTDPEVFPGAPEACDLKDNDCNGTVDEGFQFATDPDNCGTCGIRCAIGMTCEAGQCVGVDMDQDGFPPGRGWIATTRIPPSTRARRRAATTSTTIATASSTKWSPSPPPAMCASAAS